MDRAVAATPAGQAMAGPVFSPERKIIKRYCYQSHNPTIMNVIVATLTGTTIGIHHTCMYIIALVANAFGCLFSLHTGTV